jgi:hypothetical protein
MEFPFVTRRKYNRLMLCTQKLCAQVVALEDERDNLKSERDNIIGRAADLADIERKDRELERGHFEVVLTNINHRGK